jgi:hypothetical protein
MPLTRIRTEALTDANVTSPKLSQNLSISLVRVAEEGNLNVIAPGGNVDIDVLNNTVYFFGSNTTANITFNLRGNSTATLDSVLSVGETVSLAIAVKHGTERHSANLHIDGGLISDENPLILTNQGFVGNSIIYSGTSNAPIFQSISTANSEVNLFNYTVFKTAANQYTVLAGNTLFGIG